MKKNNITLVFVAIVFSIIVGMIIGKSLLKYKEGEPDVVGSFSMNRDENLLLIASSRKIKKQEAFDKIERILDGLGLKKYENYSPLELSKGTMQRLNNACAMIQEEKITIFDEPFSGLDPVQMKLLENVIVEFHKKEKGIYIISSHDIECLQNVCDKCLLLHNGQIREINMEEVDREEIAKILSEGE